MFFKREPYARYSWLFDFSGLPHKPRYSLEFRQPGGGESIVMLFMLVSTATAKLLYTISRPDVTAYLLGCYQEYAEGLFQVKSLDEAVEVLTVQPELIEVERVAPLGKRRGIIPFEVDFQDPHSLPTVSRILGGEGSLFDWLSAMRIMIRDSLFLMQEEEESFLLTQLTVKQMGLVLGTIRMAYTRYPDLIRNPRSISLVPQFVAESMSPG